jgi:hypothetical protein
MAEEEEAALDLYNAQLEQVEAALQASGYEDRNLLKLKSDLIELVKLTEGMSCADLTSNNMNLKPHCIRCSHFKVDDVSALEPSSKPPVRIVEDNVTASLHRQRTP